MHGSLVAECRCRDRDSDALLELESLIKGPERCD